MRTGIKPTEVHLLSQTTDLKYPRLLAGHPLNEGVDFSSLGRYAEHGSSADPVPVWLGERLDDPVMFPLPQKPRRIWATPGVAAAYERSGCDGLSLYPRGTVV